MLFTPPLPCHARFVPSPNMTDIAKAAGVSQGAISSLLNDRDYGIRVSDKTKERVFKVCREMGYIPNDLRAVVRMYPEVGDFCVLIAEEDFAGGIGGVIGRFAILIGVAATVGKVIGSAFDSLSGAARRVLDSRTAAGWHFWKQLSTNRQLTEIRDEYRMRYNLITEDEEEDSE
jgi:hypothetical protein